MDVLATLVGCFTAVTPLVVIAAIVATLDYRENHVRGRDGRLLRVEPVWIAEAERFDGQVVVASAEGETAEEAWAQLRADIDAAKVTTLRRVRIAGAT